MPVSVGGKGSPVPAGAVPTGAVPTGAVPTGAVPTGAVPNGVDDDTGATGEELLETTAEELLRKPPEPLGIGIVELQYPWSQPAYPAASVPFVQVEEMHLSTMGPVGG